MHEQVRGGYLAELLKVSSCLQHQERQLELDFKDLENLAKLKQRVAFIKGTKLELSLYKFEPHNFFELIYNESKSVFNQILEREVLERNRQRKNSLDEEKKEERTLKNNLALKILFNTPKELEALKRRPTRESITDEESIRSSVETIQESKGSKMIGGLLSGAQSMLSKVGDQSLTLAKMAQGSNTKEKKADLSPKEVPYKKVKYKVQSIDNFIERFHQHAELRRELKKLLFMRKEGKEVPLKERGESIDSSI